VTPTDGGGLPQRAWEESGLAGRVGDGCRAADEQAMEFASNRPHGLMTPADGAGSRPVRRRMLGASTAHRPGRWPGHDGALRHRRACRALKGRVDVPARDTGHPRGGLPGDRVAGRAGRDPGRVRGMRAGGSGPRRSDLAMRAGAGLQERLSHKRYYVNYCLRRSDGNWSGRRPAGGRPLDFSPAAFSCGSRGPRAAPRPGSGACPGRGSPCGRRRPPGAGGCARRPGRPRGRSRARLPAAARGSRAASR